MFSRDGTLSQEMHRVLRHGTGMCITAPLHPPSAPEQGSDLVCLHLALTGRRDLRKRRVGLRAEARRTWPWWRTAVDLSALAQSEGSGGMKNWRASEELMKELRSLYQGLPMARQALDKGDITGAKEILREMDRYLQDVLWTTVTMPQDPGGAPASDAVTRPKAERQRPAKAR